MMSQRLGVGARWVGVVALGGCLMALASGALVPAQDAKKAGQAGETREAIDADFQRDLARLEQQRIERLAKLAASQGKADAEATYDEIFRFAIARNYFREVEPVAEKVLADKAASPQIAYLAEIVNIIAEVDRGKFDDSYASLRRIHQIVENGNAQHVATTATLPLGTQLSVIDLYTQRLLQADRFDIARKALQLIGEKTKEPAIKDHTAGRLARLDLLGKPAPALKGNDLDGKPVDLAAMKGDVVLVSFWASWCVPSSRELDDFHQLVRASRAKGFRIIGVNLDAMQEGMGSEATVLPNVRRFLLDFNVDWPNLLNGPGARDYAQAFRVREIPANYLIGRDGTIVHIDLSRANLKRVVDKVLGAAPGGR